MHPNGHYDNRQIINNSLIIIINKHFLRLHGYHIIIVRSVANAEGREKKWGKMQDPRGGFDVGMLHLRGWTRRLGVLGPFPRRNRTQRRHDRHGETGA